MDAIVLEPCGRLSSPPQVIYIIKKKRQADVRGGEAPLPDDLNMFYAHLVIE